MCTLSTIYTISINICFLSSYNKTLIYRGLFRMILNSSVSQYWSKFQRFEIA